MANFFTDRRFRLARIWSNRELEKISPLLTGSVINVSAWKDSDKQGRFYKQYFPKADSYSISNYVAEARGFQGRKGEIFVDLTDNLDPSLKAEFDVVFNHTCLEHIFEIFTAFDNLCSLSKDLVIVVVPHLQEAHGNYGDYWRFTPESVVELFRKSSFETVYISFNDHPRSSVYIYAIATRYPEKWESKIVEIYGRTTRNRQRVELNERIGRYAIPNLIYSLRRKIEFVFKS